MIKKKKINSAFSDWNIQSSLGEQNGEKNTEI